MLDGGGRGSASTARRGPTPGRRGPTRRAFLAGLGAGAAAPLLPGGLRAVESFAAAPAPCTPNAPGARAHALAAAPGGATVWRTESAGSAVTELRGRTLAPVRAIEVGGAPIAAAIAATGRRGAVVTAGYDRPALAVLHLAAGRVTQRVDVGRDPIAVAVTRDGHRAVVAGGGPEGTLTPVDLRSGTAGTPVALGAHPRAVALAPDDEHAYVTLNGAAEVCVVALTGRPRVVQRFTTPPFPSRIAIAPDGRTALVTHDGAAERRVTPIDLRRRTVRPPVDAGLDPCGIAYDRRGRVAAVAASGAGAVVLLDGRTGRRRRTVRVPGRPRSVAYAGGAFVAADWETGALTRVPTRRAA